MSSTNLRIIACGDIVGRTGREIIVKFARTLKHDRRADLFIANAENAAGGTGIDAGSALELKQAGVDVITLGDHTWHKKEFREFLNQNADWCIRPANYPSGAAGRGWTVVNHAGISIGIANVMGRVFMNGALDCPFRGIDSIVQNELKDCKIRIVDIHAEATSEKIAMGRFLDGRVSLVYGTHTHVQTADESVLPGGTAFISDLGMCGVYDGVIGMDSATALGRFLTGLPHAYKLAEGRAKVHGVVAEFDMQTGRAVSIERLAIEG